MNTVKLENITTDDYQYISIRTKLILPNEHARYIAEVVYDDGFGTVNVLKRSISSNLDEAVKDVIFSSGLLFLFFASKVSND